MIVTTICIKIIPALPLAALWLMLASCGSNEHSAKGVIPSPSPRVKALQADGSQELLGSINRSRKLAHRTPLTVDMRLVLAAREHSDSMAQHGMFAHRGRDGSDFSKRMAKHGYPLSHSAENIAKAPSAETVFRLWLSSRGHKANMLGKNYTSAGIARAGDYWTAVFSAPDGT